MINLSLTVSQHGVLHSEESANNSSLTGGHSVKVMHREVTGKDGWRQLNDGRMKGGEEGGLTLINDPSACVACVHVRKLPVF